MHEPLLLTDIRYIPNSGALTPMDCRKLVPNLIALPDDCGAASRLDCKSMRIRYKNLVNSKSTCRTINICKGKVIREAIYMT